jgi:hypothetical protein
MRYKFPSYTWVNMFDLSSTATIVPSHSFYSGQILILCSFVSREITSSGFIGWLLVFAPTQNLDGQGGQEDTAALEHVVNQQRNALAEAKVGHGSCLFPLWYMQIKSRQWKPVREVTAHRTFVCSGSSYLGKGERLEYAT